MSHVHALPKSPPPRGFRRRLSGEQNHRCAFCGIVMTLEKSYNNSAQTVKIDKSKWRTYMNCVAVCLMCNGYAGNFESGWAFYEWVQKNGRPKFKKAGRHRREIIREHPDKCAIYLRIMREGIGDPRFRKILRGIENLSEERVREIALSNVQKYLALNRGRQPKKRSDRSHQAKVPSSLPFLRSIADVRNYLSGCQNHRCCYCHQPMGEAMKRLDLMRDIGRMVTIEHVIPSKDNGSDSLNNIVAACMACNNLRNMLGLSAEEFYEYIQSGAAGDHHQGFNDRARRAHSRRGEYGRARQMHYG